MMDQGYYEFLHDNGYSNVIVLPGNRWAATFKFAFTTAIIVGEIGDRCGYSDRWCYETSLDAVKALLMWAGGGVGEPEGWHRHPASGRRRPDGVSEEEYVNP